MAEQRLSHRQRILRLIDEFLESYERAWGNIYSQDRLGAFRWDVGQLRRKIEKELYERAHD